MSQHTTGLWTTEDHKMPSDQVFDGTGVMVADCKWTNFTPLQREAHARLIAAAPELLETLKNLVTPLEKGWNVDDMDQRIAEARAAIAKAEGRG